MHNEHTTEERDFLKKNSITNFSTLAVVNLKKWTQ